MTKLKLLKYTLMVLIVTSIFFACKSKDESETRNTQLTTDSTSYKNNMMSDTATGSGHAAVVGGAAEAVGDAAISKQNVADGPGLGGGYSERKDTVKAGKSRGPGVGGGYLAGQKKENKNGGIKK